MTPTKPTPEQAAQFALMLHVGLPSSEAILYFFEHEAEARAAHDAWVRSREVRQAKLALDGKAFEHMSLDERITHALHKHYAELAYILNSRHYLDTVGLEKVKMDSARDVLEKRQAGVSGVSDPLAAFWNDIRSGKIKLSTPIPVFQDKAS